MSTVRIAQRLVGEDQPCFVVAEIGINHNGDVDLAKRLISVAAGGWLRCGQVPEENGRRRLSAPEELAKPRENPFGPTNGDLKYGLEFEQEEYEEIDAFCKSVKMLWFASPWDEGSVDFMERFNVPVYKIASASLTDDKLLRHIRATGKPIILSTGMSTYAEIDHAVEVLGKDDLVLMHATSTYPASYPELNLRAIPTMAERYGVPIGYSGHETGIPTSVCAVALGACAVERHITMDRAMWGSDHAASLEPNGISGWYATFGCGSKLRVTASNASTSANSRS